MEAFLLGLCAFVLLVGAAAPPQTDQQRPPTPRHEVVAGPIPPEVLKRLIDGAKESQAKYDQVHIVADVEETVAGETHKHPWDFFKDGDAIKITQLVARGDRKEIVTYVASPKLTFCIRKPLGAKQFALSSIDRNGANYKSVPK